MISGQRFISHLKIWNNSSTFHDKVVVGSTLIGAVSGGVLGPRFLDPRVKSDYAVTSTLGVLAGAGSGCIVGFMAPIFFPVGILGCAIGGGVYMYDEFKKQ